MCILIQLGAHLRRVDVGLLYIPADTGKCGCHLRVALQAASMSSLQYAATMVTAHVEHCTDAAPNTIYCHM